MTPSEQPYSEIASLQNRLAAAEARIAALEARQQQVVVHYPIYGNSPKIVSDSQCPYCYQPLSRCRGHNICSS